ncbi:hypothetical protein A3Q56_02583 [Intoshia linei]|uniref:Ig-like domain-containing protein n=1 Tax=Intoshia linei TaxID=1819745 RepID=A0A177B6C6_9BILA|nr:hypothetical protein A3Q56_02583 [Intoshia linei]
MNGIYEHISLKIFTFCVFLLIYFNPIICQDIQDKPQNSATYEGGSTTFNCNGNFQDNVQAWNFKSFLKNYTEFDRLTQNSNKDINQYSISFINKDNSGIYQCFDAIRDVRYNSFLTILGINKCMVYQGEQESESRNLESNVVTNFKCSIEYMGFVAPSIDIDTKGIIDNNMIKTMNVEHPTKMHWRILIKYAEFKTSSNHHRQSFKCQFNFNHFHNNFDKKNEQVNVEWSEYIPDFTDQCESVMTVYYGPENTIIVIPSTQQEDGMYTLNVGDTIKCQSNGYPEPSYKWIPFNTNLKSSHGKVLTISADMSGHQKIKCSASRDGLEASSDFITINVVGKASVLFADEGMGTGGIAGLIIGIVLVLLIIVIVVVVLIRRRMKMNKRKRNLNIYDDETSELDKTNDEKPNKAKVMVFPNSSRPFSYTPQGIPEIPAAFANLNQKHNSVTVDDTPRSRKPINSFHTSEFENDPNAV